MKEIFKSTSFKKYRVRLADAKDSDAIIDLLANTAKWLQSKGISQWEHLLTGEENEEIIRDISNGVTYIVEEKDKIAATFNFSSKQNDWDVEMWGKLDDKAYYIHRLAINREYQNQNLGRKLLHWIDENIRLTDRCIRLDCVADNPILNHLYQETGFTFKKYVEMDGDRFSAYEKCFKKVDK
ncbi:GNAT family N-acetyltransferase [Oceanobacillus halophilus]|uniref:GNAT family N-acetyltransferase n=1 Tax=Oceanobacillus halophilus TaxID=930130 RepID=A0A494ZW51_9BACI|nr:GNAT family N-acetyltransferase [Oceanobacillus halophilus]RKQ30876.1 GNAT family N-acetyltransferase [Oceanobacillus halophilus]